MLFLLLTNGEIPGTLYGISDSGWMDDQGSFLTQVYQSRLLYAPQVQPLLLLLDGHSTHYGPEMINIAALNQIIIFALPPHTMHITQPLDCGCFSPLKIEWRRVCHKYISENPGKTVSQYEFCELFSKAWSRTFAIKKYCVKF